ncbi:ANF protein, partial [Upupa epops]|nr:ANF protein [Upupa epops]
MQFPALCCGASLLLLLLVVPRCGTQAVGGSGAELRSLQVLLEALEQLREDEGQPDLEAEPVTGAKDGGPEWEPSGGEGDSPEILLPSPGLTQPEWWRSILSSFRRRHFSGCFGTRMERIGAQTGLGCNQYQARRCR